MNEDHNKTPLNLTPMRTPLTAGLKLWRYHAMHTKMSPAVEIHLAIIYEHALTIEWNLQSSTRLHLERFRGVASSSVAFLASWMSANAPMICSPSWSDNCVGRTFPLCSWMTLLLTGLCTCVAAVSLTLSISCSSCRGLAGDSDSFPSRYLKIGF